MESAGVKPICSVVPLNFAAGSESACVADAKQLQDQTSCGELAGAFPNQGGLPRSIITKSDFSGREFVHSLGSVMVALADHTNAVISNLGSGIALTVDEKGGCLAAAKATADVIKKFNSDELKNRDHWKKTMRNQSRRQRALLENISRVLIRRLSQPLLSWLIVKFKISHNERLVSRYYLRVIIVMSGSSWLIKK